MKIITNNHLVPLLYFYELNEKQQRFVREEYDWDENLETESEFFVYKGYVYHLGDFMRVERNSDFAGWDGYSNDTYFSGILIRYARDEYGYVESNSGNQMIIVATFTG